eukprot:scaffold573405_cov20-Prasinocladus_malaysianus.AAC.1
MDQISHIWIAEGETNCKLVDVHRLNGFINELLKGPSHLSIFLLLHDGRVGIITTNLPSPTFNRHCQEISLLYLL